MAEQTNPWKKQMLNRQNTPAPNLGGTPPPPPNDQPQLNNPWKQKTTQSQPNPWKTQVQSTQPSWAKKDTTGTPTLATTQSPQPAWKKQSPIPWKKPQTPVTGNNSPPNPWMKGKTDSQKQEKQKLERQQQHKAKQEQQRIERERIELQQNLKKEMQSQKKESQDMHRQDMISQQVQEQLRQRLERDKKQASPPPKSSTKKTQSLQSTKKKPRVTQQQTTHSSIGLKYLVAFQSQFSQHQSYNEKLQDQKQILVVYSEFRRASEAKVKEIIDSHNIPDTLNMEQGIQLRFIKSRSVRNQKTNQISYDQTRMENAKRYADLSNKLQNALIQVIRKVSFICIRTPLMSLIEYRGVMCLCSGETSEESDAKLMDVTKIPRIADQINMVLKEVHRLQPNLKLQHLCCKLITNAKKEEIFVVYIKQDLQVLKQGLPTNASELVKDLNWLQKDVETAYSSNCLQSVEHSSQYQKQVVNNILLANHVNMIYRSVQGELDDQNFMSILIRQDTEFLKLLKDSGFKGTTIGKGLFLILIQRLTGLILEFGQDVFETGQVKVREAQIIFRGYKFEALQVVSISNKYLTFLQEGKTQLASESILLRAQVAQIYQTVSQKVDLALDRAQMLSQQQKYQQSNDEVQRVKEDIQQFSLSYLRMLTLLIKNYSLLQMENELLQNFGTFLTQTNFIFGHETHLNSILYSVLAGFYSRRSHQLSQAINIYLLALNIDKQMFGETSVQCGDLYLSISQAYLRHSKIQEARTSINQAIRIYQQMDNKMRLVETVVFLSQLAFKEGDKKAALQGMDKAVKTYRKSNKVKELYNLLLIKLTYEKEAIIRSDIIQQVFSLGCDFNVPMIIKKGLWLALRQEIPHLSKAKLQSLSQYYDNQAEENETPALDQCLKNIKNFPNINVLLKWAFTTSDAQTGADRGQVILKQILTFVGQDQLQTAVS